MLKLKRAYERPEAEDGERYLVDRLWPRGIDKKSLKVEGWLKDAAPSDDLRRWFHHEPDRWAEFRRRYFAELDSKPEAWTPLVEAARQGAVTLIYSARDVERNNAAALAEFLAAKVTRRKN